jgi:hypothetical protein
MTYALPHPTRTGLLLLLAALLCALPVQAQMPETIAYQGYLTDTDGAPLDGSVNLNVRLYDASAGGTALWTEDQLGVPVAGGVFSVQLGQEEPLDGVAFDQPLWLAVRVNGGNELAPRVPLSATPYALGLRGLRVIPSGDDDDAPNLIGGHINNRAGEVGPGGFLPQGVTISGGGGGTPGNDTEANVAAGNYGTIGGGRGNRASGTATTVGGGQFNEALTRNDTVAGGRNNRAEGGGEVFSATVGGGENNTASGEAATVAGGVNNTASGNFSSVPGGRQNLAAGYGSMAAGQQARAAHDAAFVWADRSDGAFSSTDANQFLIRAAGGVGIGVNAPEGALHVTHPEDDMDLILGGAEEDALFGDDGTIASDPALPSSDLLLVSNDALAVILNADGSDETAEFIVADNGFAEAFRVDLTGTTSTGHLELQNDLGTGDAPAEGGVYRDNVVYAWAHVNADGSVTSSFGCTVTRLGLGRYRVDYDQALPNGMAPVVTPLSANDPVIATAAPSGSDGATVVVFAFVGGQFQNGDRPFFLQVVGRP